jgi:hypothetical protein
MASSDPAVPERRHYGDHRPYPDPPDRLADLTGPTAGTIVSPITIYWVPTVEGGAEQFAKRSDDMAVDADRRVVCEIVLQEAATTEQLCQYINPPGCVTAALASPAYSQHLGGASPAASRGRLGPRTSTKRAWSTRLRWSMSGSTGCRQGSRSHPLCRYGLVLAMPALVSTFGSIPTERHAA